MTTLTADGLALRQWADADANALVAIHRDPSMRRWTRTLVTTDDEATAWVAAQRDGWAAGTRHSFDPRARHGFPAPAGARRRPSLRARTLGQNESTSATTISTMVGPIATVHGRKASDTAAPDSTAAHK